MMIALGLIRIKTDKPILKVELFSLLWLEESVLIEQLLKFVQSSKGKIIPWNKKEAYPTDMGNMFSISISCFLEFKSFNDLRTFQENSDGYKFFQN